MDDALFTPLPDPAQVTPDLVPAPLLAWFQTRGWWPHAHQLAMIQAWRAHADALLIAPTGGGKTLAGFLPALIEIDQRNRSGQTPPASRRLHTLYLSPLKALAQDIRRNLLRPIEQAALEVTVDSRTGDTTAAERKRQRQRPPDILLTTPESLMLLLSHPDSLAFFAGVQAVILDEVHALMPSKRGDLTALGLARLDALAPGHRRIGLSATVADPPGLAAWLGRTGRPPRLVNADPGIPHDITVLTQPAQTPPIGGYMGVYAAEEVYGLIQQTPGVTLVFVNTRAQAELMFQALWALNEATLPIALHHGSLSKEQRLRVEAAMADGSLRAIVSTASLDLGIDWGDVALVLQVGAPKGVSRLIQRTGRAGHRLDTPSVGVMIPCNRFEVIECQAALNVLARGELDGEARRQGSLDVVVQYITTAACAAPVHPDALYAQIRGCPLYADLDRPLFDQLVRFATDGGYVLHHYEQFQRLTVDETGRLQIARPGLAQRHRMNIGTIVEEAKLKVKRLSGKSRSRLGGRIIGEVEEVFALGLEPGDTFVFAGEVLRFEGVREMMVEARPAIAKGPPKVAVYAGGRMPLTTHLANEVRRILSDPPEWAKLPRYTADMLALQAEVSCLPGPGELLVECFPRGSLVYLVVYAFEGRKAHQTLGMILTRRLEDQGCGPLGFVSNDYTLAVWMVQAPDTVEALFTPDILTQELEDWIADSSLLKRSFRSVALIAGLTERRQPGAERNARQVTLSTDLIYDVLRQHEPGHVLLEINRRSAADELLDLDRLRDFLHRHQGHIRYVTRPRITPLAIPAMVEAGREMVSGSGQDMLLAQADLAAEAEQMLSEIQADAAGARTQSGATG